MKIRLRVGYGDLYPADRVSSKTIKALGVKEGDIITVEVWSARDTILGGVLQWVKRSFSK